MGTRRSCFGCGATYVSRAGRPRKDGNTKIFTSGWFMLECVPQDDGRRQCLAPEGSGGQFRCGEIVESCSVYDRNCKFAPSAERDEDLKQLKYYPVDTWRDEKHNEACKYS